LNTTFQSGSHDDVRIQFLNNGRLPNTRDTAFRAIEDGWPVFGLSHDLGEVSGPTSPLVFSVGLGALLSRARAFGSQVYSDAKKISSDYADIVALSLSYHPGDQYSSDDSFAGHLPNQTNLAIKGVLAIGAMSEVAHNLGEEDKSRKYKVGSMPTDGLPHKYSFPSGHCNRIFSGLAGFVRRFVGAAPHLQCKEYF
ncbi:hypothetical protein H0H92_012609, partial [Tricholoma furcatifolium]